MTHLVGRQLGRYLLQQEIGRGGMARVFRALDTSLQLQVAFIQYGQFFVDGKPVPCTNPNQINP